MSREGSGSRLVGSRLVAEVIPGECAGDTAFGWHKAGGMGAAECRPGGAFQSRAGRLSLGRGWPLLTPGPSRALIRGECEQTCAAGSPWLVGERRLHPREHGLWFLRGDQGSFVVGKA